ncbi:uncharacterized protein N7496_006384, partial [Penicillium cataractarum]
PIIAPILEADDWAPTLTHQHILPNAPSHFPRSFFKLQATRLGVHSDLKMVGIGGRSKGCKTCRRRRVKCDEAKPTCERCQKLSLKCEGYVQFPEFVDMTVQFTGKKSAKQKPVENDVLSSSTSASTATHGSTASPRPESSVIELPLTSIPVNPKWNEQSMFTSHLVRKLFTWHDDKTSPRASSWIELLFQRTEDEAALSFTSVSALATTYFAKVNRNGDLMRKGAGFYSRALRTLRSNLEDSTLALEDDLVVAVICMAIYEMITFTQPTGWLHHYKGLARLTAMRGPHRHQSGVASAILPTLRSCIAAGYLVERKRCFLESPEWKTIPWAKRGLHTKTPSEELQDLLCDLPGYLEDIDKIFTWNPKKSGKEELAKDLCSRVLTTLEALYAWRWDWEQKFPNSTYLISPRDLDVSSIRLPPSPFESIIWFTSPHRAAELMTYNAIRLITTRTLEMFGIDMPSSDIFISDPLLPMEGTRHDVAVEICRMTEYHLHAFSQSSGAFMLIFPLNVAHLHLNEDKGRIKPWLEAVMSVVADLHGFELGRKENMPRRSMKHDSKFTQFAYQSP